jgi:hypothetical protein
MVTETMQWCTYCTSLHKIRLLDYVCVTLLYWVRGFLIKLGFVLVFSLYINNTAGRQFYRDGRGRVGGGGG